MILMQLLKYNLPSLRESRGSKLVSSEDKLSIDNGENNEMLVSSSHKNSVGKKKLKNQIINGTSNVASSESSTIMDSENESNIDKKVISDDGQIIRDDPIAAASVPDLNNGAVIRRSKRSRNLMLSYAEDEEAKDNQTKKA